MVATITDATMIVYYHEMMRPTYPLPLEGCGAPLRAGLTRAAESEKVAADT